MNNELIEAAKAVIGRWDSTDWKAAPAADVMNRLRAALSKEPVKLPEVKEWISFNCFFDHYITNQTVIRTAIVYTYLQQLTNAHAAELADLSHQVFRQREENVRLVGVIARQNGDVELAESKGRQEALAYDPPIPPEIKGRVQAEWFWKGVLAMREQEETK